MSLTWKFVDSARMPVALPFAHVKWLWHIIDERKHCCLCIISYVDEAVSLREIYSTDRWNYYFLDPFIQLFFWIIALENGECHHHSDSREWVLIHTCMSNPCRYWETGGTKQSHCFSQDYCSSVILSAEQKNGPGNRYFI